MTWKGYLAAVGAVALLMPAEAAYQPAGMDEFDSSARVTIDLRASGGPELSVTADGRTRIERGDPQDDPGDGRAVIDTEIVSMALRSVTPLGEIEIRENPARPSAGIIKQQEPGTDYPADSFFDVFVEVHTPLGVFHNKTAIRLNSVIDALPPFQAEYIPKETFVGVDLFNASGQKAGVIKHAAHFVGQKPSFSVAPAGSSGLRAADILDVPTAVRIPAEQLGLTAQNAPLDDVDGLSYGTAFINDAVMDMRFSVDPATVGAGGAVRIEASKGEAHGDEFMALKFNSNNTQILDENGDTAPPFPLVVNDDVDSLALPPASFVDPDGNGTPAREVYFTLTAGSPSLGTLGASPADILVTSGGATPTKFLEYDDLGLQETDDIDAFCMDARTKTVVYSLARNSTSLTGGLGPADLFIASPAPVSTLSVFAPASELGLLPEDNLNALKCIPGEVDHYPFVKGFVVLNEEPVALQGTATIHVGVGPNGEALTDSGHDGGIAEVMNVALTGESSEFGPVQVMRRVPEKYPHVRSGGSLSENTNLTPEVLDLCPFTPDGIGFFDLNLFLEFIIGQWTGLHHPNPIPLFGEVTYKPPLPDELLFTSGTTELFLEGGSPVGVVITDLIVALNGDLTPDKDVAMKTGSSVNSASYKRGVTADSIVAGFGTNLLSEPTPAPVNTMINAMRTADVGTTVVIRDSEGNESGGRVFAINQTQVNYLFGPDVALGPAIVTATREDGRTASTSVQVNEVAPGLYTANFSGTGVAAAFFLHVAADGTRTPGVLYDPSTLVSTPIDLGAGGDSVFLEMFGTGFRDGSQFSVTVGGMPVTVTAAEAHSEFFGLDQLNIGPLPRGLIGRGEVDIVFTVDGIAANTVTVNIK